MDAISIEEFEKKYGKNETEAGVQRAVLEHLQYHPLVAFAMRINAGAIKTEKGALVRMAPAGTSDIIGMLRDGRFLAVEIKAGKNKPTQLQQEFMDQVNEDGGLAFCAWAVDDVEKMLMNQEVLREVLGFAD